MTPDFSMADKLAAAADYFIVSGLIAGIFGSLFGGGDHDEDEIVEADDIILDALSDADRTAVTEIITGRNWRDQLTIEDAIELYNERELMNMGKQRN